MAPPTIAFGPENPAFGSWQWLGVDLAHELARDHEVGVFRDQVPAVDVVVFLKFLPDADALAAVRARAAVVYCPIDLYGSASEIDGDVRRLRACDQIVVHGPRLRHYFSSYAPTIVLDHHLKYTIPIRTADVPDGPILWIGERSNLPPLVAWWQPSRLPAPLVVLTNLAEPTTPQELGFPPDADVRVEAWSPDAHRSWLTRCRAVIDLKGDDFRARHKPPAKALDYLASGLPLAMNAPSSGVDALQARGFAIPRPEETDRWLSRGYAEECRQFAPRLCEQLSLSRLGQVWRALLHAVYRRRTARSTDS